MVAVLRGHGGGFVNESAVVKMRSERLVGGNVDVRFVLQNVPKFVCNSIVVRNMVEDRSM